MNVMFRRLVCSLLLATPTVALAQQDGLHVENAWSRAAVKGGTGVVYLTITDTGAPDRLTSVAAPVAAKAELHESFIEQGVAKMRSIAALPVSADKPVALAPGGMHIMLIGLKQDLKNGDSFPITLAFERSGQLSATVTVGRTGGVPSGHDAMGGMTMPAGKTQ